MRSTPFLVNVILSRNVQHFDRAELQDRVDDSAVTLVISQNNLSHNEIVITFVSKSKHARAKVDEFALVVCCDRYRQAAQQPFA
jgi:hypothetical protein